MYRWTVCPVEKEWIFNIYCEHVWCGQARISEGQLFVRLT